MSTVIRVPVFKGNGVLNYEVHPEQQLNAINTIKIKVLACGICGTDLNILSVPPMHKANVGIVIGHEAVGTIVDFDSNFDAKSMGFSIGDRVVIAPRILCRNCMYCRMGLHNQCVQYQTVGTTREGAFAPYITLPHSAVYKIDHNVSIENASFFEPLSCVVGALARVPFQLGDTVAVIGAGPMGSLFALCCKAMGAASVSMIDVSQERLDFVTANAIADRVIHFHSMSQSEHLSVCSQFDADIVVDAVGNQMQLVSSLLRPGGHAVLFGLKPDHEQKIQQYMFTRYDYTVHGVFVGVHPFIQTIKILESAVLTPAVLITHRFPLEKLEEGIVVMRQAKGMKVLIDINSDRE